MENESRLNDISPNTIQTLTDDVSELYLGGSNPLVDLSTVLPLIVGSLLLLGLFVLIIATIIAVFKIKERRATAAMRNDIKAIRELLEQNLKATPGNRVHLADDQADRSSNVT